MWVRVAPCAQQAGGQRVPGLMGDPAAEVELVDPGPEPELEPLVGDRGGPVGVAVAAGEQRHAGPFGGRGGAAVPGDEPGQGVVPACGEPRGERFGDADRLVVAADLGLVVPEHGQPAVAADAVQPQAEHLADPPPGDDDRLPDVAQPEVGGVEASASRARLASSARARATSSVNGLRLRRGRPRRRASR